jgi:hypothetical protein
VTKESDLHQEKQLSLKISTNEGRMISNKTISQNAPFSIRDNLGPDSNITEGRDLHKENTHHP